MYLLPGIVELVLNTDLSIVDTEDEIHPDLSTWTPAERKKLQHMTEFHEEYQCVFGKQASLPL